MTHADIYVLPGLTDLRRTYVAVTDPINFCVTSERTAWIEQNFGGFVRISTQNEAILPLKDRSSEMSSHKST